MPRTYKIGNDVFDIPDNELEAFVKDNPEASEVSSFVLDKDTLDIPINEVQDFIKENPNAKPIGAKKKYIRIEIGFWYIRINDRTITFRSPITFS